MPSLLPRLGLLIAFTAACVNGATPHELPDARPPGVENDAAHADSAHDAGRSDVPRDVPANRCPGGSPLPYPTAADIAVASPLPDLTFTGEGGATVRLSRYYTPCAARPKLLVLRVMGAWSGPARFLAARTRRFRAHPESSRLDVVDLLALNEVNLPAQARDLAAWRTRYDVPPDVLAADPEYRFRALYLGAGHLPLVMLVDPRTMVLTRAFEVPESEDLSWEISSMIAGFDSRVPPPRTTTTLYDGRLTPDEWEMAREMSLPATPPPDPTNRYADDAMAARLGEALFNDPGLSSNGEVSCASCHRPNAAFVDGRPTGMTLATGDRNTPTVLLSAHQRWQFWDGRADSLWSQALGPVENDAEMGGSRVRVARHVASRYGSMYAAVFGPLPDLSQLPAQGRPGTPEWERMTESDRATTNRVFVHVGKAIAAFERTLRAPRTTFDAYLAGDVSAMTPEARDGLRRFIEFGCVQCHHGPTLSDDSFHNVQFASGRRDGAPDLGRINGVSSLRESPFRADGMFSDAPMTNAHLAALDPVDAMRGQFHTPTLRDVARTGPWGHGGTFTTLNEVMLHYATIVTRAPPATTTGEGDLHLGSFHMDDATLRSLSALMEAMSAPGR